MTARATLVDRYLKAVAALVAKYPAQAQNSASFVRFATNAKLARVARHVRTKGCLSEYQVGALVLCVADDFEPGMVSIWGRTDGDSLRTLVNPDAVEVLS